MAIVPTTLAKQDLLAPVPTRSGGRGPVARDDVMGWVQSSIPSGSASRRDAGSDSEVDALVDRAFDAMAEGAGASGILLSGLAVTRR